MTKVSRTVNAIIRMFRMRKIVLSSTVYIFICLFSIAFSQDIIPGEYIVQIQGRCEGNCRVELLISIQSSIGPSCYFADNRVIIGSLSFELIKCPADILPAGVSPSVSTSSSSSIQINSNLREELTRILHVPCEMQHKNNGATSEQIFLSEAIQDPSSSRKIIKFNMKRIRLRMRRWRRRALSRTPRPFPSSSPCYSQSPSSSPSPTVTPTSSVSPSESASKSPIVSQAPSVSASPSQEPIENPSESASARISPSPTLALSASASPSLALSASASPSLSLSASASPSIDLSASAIPSLASSASESPILASSASASPSIVTSVSQSPSASSSTSLKASVSPSPSERASLSPSPSASPSGSVFASASPTTSASASISVSPSASSSPSASASPSMSSSPVAVVPWGVDQVDGEDDSQRSCSGSNLGNGVNVLVIDTGCTPTNGGLCSSAFDSDNGGCTDIHGHGSHVAGTVGDPNYGIATKSTVSCYKSLGDSGSGTVFTVLKGIEYGMNNGVDVMNLSLGGSVSTSQNDAVVEAGAAGIYMVVSAGNDGADACTKSPASASGTNVYTVQAHAEDGSTAYFSNYGSCTDITAPGVSILSLTPSGGTTYKSGTSMAAPHVAGIAAMMKSDGRTISLSSLTAEGFSVTANDNNQIVSLGISCT